MEEVKYYIPRPYTYYKELLEKCYGKGIEYTFDPLGIYLHKDSINYTLWTSWNRLFEAYVPFMYSKLIGTGLDYDSETYKKLCRNFKSLKKFLINSCN